jgi:hypothetical protein
MTAFIPGKTTKISATAPAAINAKIATGLNPAVPNTVRVLYPGGGVVGYLKFGTDNTVTAAAGDANTIELLAGGEIETLGVFGGPDLWASFLPASGSMYVSLTVGQGE